MYYFTADTIYQANEKIKTLDAKTGGLLCILHCLTEDIVENISYTINGEMLRKQLSFVFDREPKDSFDNSKASYIIFAKNWSNTFFSNSIKNKIDLLSCAIFFMRRFGFERELTKEEVIDTFITQFNLKNYKDEWFCDDGDFTITYNQSDVEVNQREFYNKRKYDKEFKSILFSGVIQKSAADIKAAGQIQTLYSGSGVQKCFLLSDEPLDKYYIMTANTSLEESNVYQRAADILTKHIEESGLELPSNDDVTEQCRAEFMERYSPDKLEALSDSELLEYIFYSDGDNSESLCYWIERNPQCRELFGSISGGSAYKFGLFKKKDTGVWTSGSANNSKELTDEEALKLGKSIRDALVNGSRLIAEANPQTIEEYEKMDDDLKELIGDQFYNMAWFHKYYAITTGDILSCYHNDVWKYHILYALLIKPSEKSYARSGQIAMVRRYANMSYNAMHHVIVDKFGMPKTFVRIGTTDEKMNYTDEWKKRSVVGIGWKDIGSLDSYLYGDGIEKKAIADKLQEIYYGNDARTASRKAGELVRFYKTNEDTVFVAMTGERLIAFVDGIGNYFYDSSSDMSHMKPGRWHENFTPADVLPEKSEGKLTSCYQLTAEDNLMYLYRKYYYPDDDMELEVNLESEDPEERNKRLFRYWMGLQVKPEGDSDAGNPYSEQSIDSYVNSIEKTPLPMVAEHSVFYTTDIGQVNQAMDELKKEPEKNGSQRSAVKKYIQYLIDSEEDYMKLIYNTNIDVDYERNRIVFGAPGTGKSFGLKDDCDKLMEDTVGTYERVTFHPDYSYSQFVGTYKPVMDSDGRSIRYDFVPGPFMRVYVDALKSGRTEAPQPHLLLIEEINRAKVAAVFGDVFQLLDRDDDGVSEYEIQASEDIRRYLASQLGGDADNYKKIRIPNNMFIWATMNSADQGVFPMDTAFKRRWNFEYLGINENEEKIASIGNIKLAGSDDVINWNTLRKAINAKLSSDDFRINEDKLMGPFFLSKKIIKSGEDGMIEDTEKFIKAFKSKVIMYLYEDAVKQRKHNFFDGCDSSKYSSVCDAFDKKGMGIFGDTFKELYYDKQRNDA